MNPSQERAGMMHYTVELYDCDTAMSLRDMLLDASKQVSHHFFTLKNQKLLQCCSNLLLGVYFVLLKI